MNHLRNYPVLRPCIGWHGETRTYEIGVYSEPGQADDTACFAAVAPRAPATDDLGAVDLRPGTRLA